ncbi:hypothetical protein TNCV_2965421 [Trichonephila clavipes]|nr:hypothetical protein TNCV_2965421 [Trichonephila clavipes]
MTRTTPLTSHESNTSERNWTSLACPAKKLRNNWKAIPQDSIRTLTDCTYRSRRFEILEGSAPGCGCPRNPFHCYRPKSIHTGGCSTDYVSPSLRRYRSSSLLILEVPQQLQKIEGRSRQLARRPFKHPD